MISVNGGTYNLAQTNTVSTLSLAGGTVTCNNPFGGLVVSAIVCNGSAITSTITFSNPSGTSDIEPPSQTVTPIQVAAGTTSSGIDLDLYARLGSSGFSQSFIKTGPGVLRLNTATSNANLEVSGGKLRVDNFAALGTGVVSLMLGPPFNMAGERPALPRRFPFSGGLTGIEVLQAGTSLTLTTPLTGNGGLAIRGAAGRLVLPAGSTYGAGGPTIDGAYFLVHQ